jgi:hypothetical protein
MPRMIAAPRPRACLVPLLALLALPAAAQEAGLPRVLYGTPAPQVFYGTPIDPAPAPRPAPPPVAAAPLPPPPQTSLTYQYGPAYLPPPSYWNRPPAWGSDPSWHSPPRRIRPTPPASPRFVSPESGYFERPLPQGTYVGRPPSAPRENPFQPRPWRAPEAYDQGRLPGR